MRSQIERIQERARKDHLQRGDTTLVGDRTRRRLFDELAALSVHPHRDDASEYYYGDVSIRGIYVRPQ